MGEVDAVAVDRRGRSRTANSLSPMSSRRRHRRGDAPQSRRRTGTSQRASDRHGDTHPATEDGVEDLPAVTASRLSPEGIRGESINRPRVSGTENAYARWASTLFTSRREADGVLRSGATGDSSDHRSDGGVVSEETPASGGGAFAGNTLAALEREGRRHYRRNGLGTAGCHRYRRRGTPRLRRLSSDCRRRPRACRDADRRQRGDRPRHRRQVGVDEYRAGLLPEEKVAAVEELPAEYGRWRWSATGSTTPSTRHRRGRHCDGCCRHRHSAGNCGYRTDGR